MTKEKAVSLLSQMFLIQFSNEEHEALAMAIDALNADRKTEPQIIRCPKCGRTDYIRDMEKDMGVKGSCFKYKGIDCNTYIKTEPQTCSVNGRPYSECGSCEHFKCTADEPQTDCTDNCHKCKRIRECGYPLVGKCEYEPQTERSSK